MKIGCLQFAPAVGDVGNNLNRADEILNKAQNIEDIDLLVLPELAFTGYNFRSLSEISPFLEHSGRGISALWAQTTALKLNCNVIVGYPETVDVSHKWPASPEFYNAAIVVSKDGETIGNYRKSFLYAVDETWALEGQDGFFEGHIDGLGDVAMGICMDLNPYKFEAPWHNFEFAFHALEIKANLVIVTMAWLTREGAETISQIPQEPDFQTLEYWVQRLEPLIRRGSREEIIVVFCNRCGIEGDAVYAGTSAVIGIKNGEVNIYGVLGRGLQEVLVVDTNNPPLAKLLSTSHGRRAGAAESDGYDSNQSIAGSSPNVSRKSTPFPPRQAFHPFRGDGPSEAHDGGAQGTQHEDVDDAWEIMSTAASHGSAPSLYSHSGRMPPRNQMPRLELQIPYSTGTAGPLSKLKDSLHATQNQEGKPPAVLAGEILTPTAPSPTPMSVRPYFNTPNAKSSTPAKNDSTASTLGNSSGEAPVKARRSYSSETPPLRSVTKEKARGPTPTSGASPLHPLREESTQNSTRDPREYSIANRNPQKQVDGLDKQSNLKTDPRKTHRPRASSLSTQADRTRPQAPVSVTPAIMSAMPTSTTYDSIWADVRRNLDVPDSGSKRDSMFCQPDLDDVILFGWPFSQIESQEEESISQAQEEFSRLVHANNKWSSPAMFSPPAHPEHPELPELPELPEHPSSARPSNATASRFPRGSDKANLRRSMSQSHMSSLFSTSPTDLRQQTVSHSRTRRSELPIHLRSEATDLSPSTQSGHSRQSSESRYQLDPSYIEAWRANSPNVYSSTPTGHNTPSQRASGSGTRIKQPLRPVSRGRQPISEVHAASGTGTPTKPGPNGQARRTSDSMDRGRQISSSRATGSVSRSALSSARPSRDQSQSTNSSSSWLLGTPPLAHTQPPLDPGDEIIAMINVIRNGCPTHDSRAPSLEPQSQRQTMKHGRSQSQTQNRTQAQGQGQDPRQNRQSSQQRERPVRQQQRQGTTGTRASNQQQPPSQQLLLQQQQQQQQRHPSQAPTAQGDNAQEPIYEIILPPHLRELVETMSSPEPRAESAMQALDSKRHDRTAQKFNPPTPTAMKFDKNEEEGTPAAA